MAEGGSPDAGLPIFGERYHECQQGLLVRTSAFRRTLGAGSLRDIASVSLPFGVRVIRPILCRVVLCVSTRRLHSQSALSLSMATHSHLAVIALIASLIDRAHGQSLSGMASSSVLAARAISSTLAVVVDEYATTDELQNSPIQSTTIPNCFVTTPNGYSSYGANSANGAYAMFTCGTATNPSNGNHPIIRIDAGGNIDTTAYYAGDTYYLPRGVASMDGLNVFTGDGEHRAGVAGHPQRVRAFCGRFTPRGARPTPQATASTMRGSGRRQRPST